MKGMDLLFWDFGLVKLMGRVSYENLIDVGIGQESAFLKPEGEELGNRSEVPIQQFCGFVLIDGLVADRHLQESISDSIE
jgi:hypothetical protein